MHLGYLQWQSDSFQIRGHKVPSLSLIIQEKNIYNAYLHVQVCKYFYSIVINIIKFIISNCQIHY